MSDQASFALRSRNPDVLTCIANLSNDEVFTPPEFANRMLDTLAEGWAADNGGADLWADKKVKFLDPFTKSGARGVHAGRVRSRSPLSRPTIRHAAVLACARASR